ncbi:hypothetical protein [Erwinia phage Zoomie]|uniref:Uncharacterized protein n=1 Tax=Erwinia phage Zoomie TaxID=2851072 RepID=A0A9E6T390_9CAUD|nr:hypothetical protein [Erwinia phage Zoomie]
MAYANATKAQKQALRDALVNTTKLVEQVQEFGQPGYASAVDAQLAKAKTALDAVVSAAGA